MPGEWLTVASGIQIKLFFDANQVPDAEWHALNHSQNLFTSLDYLRGLQYTAPPEMSFCYVIARKGKRNFAGYIFQSIHLSAEILAEVLAPISKQKTIMANMTEWFRKCREEKGLRVLISGNNFVSGEHGIVTRPSDEKEAFIRMPDIVKAITKQLIQPLKVSMILVKDYYSCNDGSKHGSLRKRRYHAFAVEPEMIVEIRSEWDSFDKYISSMSKKYRNRAKTVMKRSEALTEHHLSEEELRLNIDKLFPLYMGMHGKARFRLAALTPEYFIEMKRRFPGKFAAIMYTVKGKPVGFRTFFLNDEDLEAHFIGVNYALNKELDIYQRILYDFVCDAIKTGRKRLLLGRTAAEIKSTVGAVAHDFTCYIRHRNSIHNQVIRPFIDYLKPSAWTPRNPFRNGE